MKQPLVSIVVPVYNVEEYVEKCLNSLLAQTYQNIEIIVVDDGAKDKSGEICDEIAERDSRIKVFHKKNGGLSSARNYGIKKAKGEYVCLVDSDDYVRKSFVKSMLDAAQEYNADIVVCGYNDQIPDRIVLTGEQATIRLLTQQENMEIIAWNKVYRRRLFDDIQYPEGKNYEDTLTTYKILSKANKVTYINKSLYCYVERSGSITKKDDKREKLVHRELAAKEAMEFFKGRKNLVDAAEIALLTAKLAWADFAISGKVEKCYLDETIRWVRANRERMLSNKNLSKKLRIYIELLTLLNGKLYVLFRKIRHE